MLLPLLNNLAVSTPGRVYSARVLSSRRVSVRGKGLQIQSSIEVTGNNGVRVTLRGGSYKHE